MGYEELQDMRAKRVETEAAKAAKAKGKRGQKRAKASSEANAMGPKRKVARVSEEVEAAQARCRYRGFLWRECTRKRSWVLHPAFCRLNWALYG